MGDPDRLYGRIVRASALKHVVPKLYYKGSEIMAYYMADGYTLYEIDDEKIYKKFFDWVHGNVWKSNPKPLNLYVLCWDFYHNKTLNRMNGFLAKKDKSFYESHVIEFNGVQKKVAPIEDYISAIDWEWICNGTPGLIHGDLQFDNVIYHHGNDQFTLIDWRENFSSSVETGDIYYDLSKMYGGILMNYNYMKSPKHYWVKESQGVIQYGWNHSGNWHSIKDHYEQWVTDAGFDLKKVKMLTALIFLNMSPLHCDDFDDILFYHSKYMMSDLLDV